MIRSLFSSPRRPSPSPAPAPPSSPPMADPSSSKLPPDSAHKHHRPPRFPKENVDPSAYSAPATGNAAGMGTGKPFSARNRSPLPPRPPPKRSKPNADEVFGDGPAFAPSVALGGGMSDSGVQVVVRIRPPTHEEEEDEVIVKKTSENSVVIFGQDIVFDSVADTGATQEDIFKLVGLPLVENCLAGFNSSIFAYGQTGSGKTYTMWGPPSALTDNGVSAVECGLTPRVFERLFYRIEEERIKHVDKQLSYQCSCSFLEIYNEQITDLLDPSQRNLMIREDVKTGVYVESLTKENVCTMKDVTLLLIKGLANRRTGATVANAESSRSHCVFTCVIESRCMNLEDGRNSLKISRINLVDLAGSERQGKTHAAGDRLKEAGNINRSLSQLGNLINILAEVSLSGKPRHIPYRDSRLTFLLQESLGGNAKLAMICAVSPSQSCKSETLSTLRFAQRAKAIRNKAVVNEIAQDNVDVLRAQIRELKEELHRIKTVGASGNANFSTGWNARKSLRLLRMSLSNSPSFPAIQDDSDEEMEIDDNDVEKLPPSSVELLRSSKDTPKRNNAMDIDVPTPTENTSSNVHPTVDEPCEGDRLIVEDHPEKRRSSMNIEASIQKGLQILRSHQDSGAFRMKSICARTVDSLSSIPVCKVDIGIQTDPQECDGRQLALVTIQDPRESGTLTETNGMNDGTTLQLVPVNTPMPSVKRQPLLKAAEKVLAGAIRREMAIEEQYAKQAVEIRQLNRLVQQYKHERECNAVIAETREAKITRLERLMDGILPTEEFMQEEYLSLLNEHKILQTRYENHPDVLRLNLECKRLQKELEEYKNFFKMDEKEVLLDEIQDLRNQVLYSLRSSSGRHPSVLASTSRRLQLTHQAASALHPLDAVPEKQDSNVGGKREESIDWTEAESRWITLTEELRVDLEANRSLAERLKDELNEEKKCSDELKEALETAIKGHGRILEQYADLQEKHISLHAMHRKISDGIEDVKKAAAKAGVRGAESKFINTLAAEVSVLRAEREKERRHWRDENKGLQAQLRDTTDAVQAAGELLVRLKEAEEAALLAQKRATMAEQETEKAYQEIDNLKKNYEREILLRNQFLAESRLPPEALKPAAADDDSPSPTIYGSGDSSLGEDRWRDVFDNDGGSSVDEVSKCSDPNSWFSEYDRCNI